LARRHPVHITIRVLAHVYNLRTQRCLKVISAALDAANHRLDFKVIHYSVQGNHIHLIVEAEDKRALARGMQGLQIRIAKGLNRVMKRHGRVFEDRYHAHVLKSVAEVRNALAYVEGNHRKHAAQRGETISARVLDGYASAGPMIDPRTWLLKHAGAG
jgi:putative transposase